MMPHRRRPSIWCRCSSCMEQSATCWPLCDFFEHLQEASQDPSLPVVIQPPTFCFNCLTLFNQILRVLEVLARGTLNLTLPTINYRPLLRQPLFRHPLSRHPQLFRQWRGGPRVGLGRFTICGLAGLIGTVQICWNYGSGNLRKHNTRRKFRMISDFVPLCGQLKLIQILYDYEPLTWYVCTVSGLLH